MDMDIDMDIDLDLEDQRMLHEQTEHAEQPLEPPSNTIPSTVEIPQDPMTEQPADQIIPILDKVHIRGLDNLSSGEVKKYAGEHYPLDSFVRIEWIDDTSANLLYDPAQAAEEALIAFTNLDGLDMTIEEISSLQLRPAKAFSEHPDTKLFVRQSTYVDVKKKGAHDASRYYLLNPDQDPRERKRMQDSRKQHDRHGSGEDGDYNRNHFDDNELKRRRRDQSNAFDVHMYDDEPGPGPRDERRKRTKFLRNGEDLFANRTGRSVDGRLRNRSASPDRDGEGMMGFESDGDLRARSRRVRRRTPSPGYQASNRNIGKELFPSGASGASHSQVNASKELFPTKVGGAATTAVRSSLELFPNKRQSFSNHRRKDAVDASGSGHAEFFASSVTPPPTRERSLADRISGRPATATDDNRLNSNEGQGMTIRGMGGMSIRGMASTTGNKELFPLKAGNNVGKELLGDKLSGTRRKEGNLFS